MKISFNSQFIITNDEPLGDAQQQFSADAARGAVDTRAFEVNANLAGDLTLGLFSAPARSSLQTHAPEVSPSTQPQPAAYGFPMASSVAAATDSPTATSTNVSSAPTAAGVAASVVSSVPSWVAALSTASIAADMTAADISGAVGYSGLEKLLADIDSTLTSSNTALTAAELADLKAIAANLNNGMTTSSYLTGVMNALVNGNAANATWTGGAASSTTLGNLASGSSATQLSELVGKWFLGADLPSSQVMMSGYPGFSVSYSACSNPLFAATGPSMNDVNQGYLGDCYFLSSLAEVADQNSGIISSMFTSNGNNTYGVRFYVNGVADYVTVNNSLANGGTEFNRGSDVWASLAEKAYAQLQAGGVVTGNTVNYGNSWSTIGNGGWPAFALEEITGASAITDYSANGSSWATTVYNSTLSSTSHSSGLSSASLIGTLISDLAQGDDLILTSYTDAKDSSGRTTLVSDHALSIYGYDSATTMLEIRNPWGTTAGQTWNTTFEVSLSTLLSAGDIITVDNMGKGLGIAAPVLSSQTGTQTWKLGQAVSFALAADTFTDPQGENLTYKATLANGSALPSWLKFNAATGTFTGTVPNTAKGLSVKVTATNTGGASTSETFSIATPACAPTVTAPTAAQKWTEGQAVSLTLAANTFTDPQGEKLTYAATQANGSALPSWLKFNAKTDTFTGKAPMTASTLSITVKATDTSGLSTSEIFAVSIAATASKLTQAISALAPLTGSASAALSHLASATSPTLASPIH